MSSSSDDEWGTAELDIPSKSEGNKGKGDGNGNGDDDWDNKGKHLQVIDADDDGDDDEWMPKAKISNAPGDTDPKPFNKSAGPSGNPMILIDLTRLDPDIHNKFDKNGISDPAAASALRKKIESQYEQYSKDARLLADGTVIPCSTSVWRGAIQRMRDERPGHYFAPIFPPPSTKK